MAAWNQMKVEYSIYREDVDKDNVHIKYKTATDNKVSVDKKMYK